jgi:hypothetical protein
MAITYEPLQTITLASNTTTVSFSSIPSTYTDLQLVMVGTGTNQFFIRFNGDTATNYSSTVLTGSGSSAVSERESSNGQGITMLRPGYGIGVGQPVFFTADIFSYAGSTFKTLLGTGNLATNNTSGLTNINVGLWRSTTAINSVDCYNGYVGGGNHFSIGCTFTLYGIKKA